MEQVLWPYRSFHLMLRVVAFMLHQRLKNFYKIFPQNKLESSQFVENIELGNLIYLTNCFWKRWQKENNRFAVFQSVPLYNHVQKGCGYGKKFFTVQLIKITKHLLL